MSLIDGNVLIREQELDMLEQIKNGLMKQNLLVQSTWSKRKVVASKSLSHFAATRATFSPPKSLPVKIFTLCAASIFSRRHFSAHPGVSL